MSLYSPCLCTFLFLSDVSFLYYLNPSNVGPVSLSLYPCLRTQKTQREALESSSTRFQSSDAHVRTESFLALFASINHPQSWTTPNAFHTLTSTHSNSSTSPTLAPDCQELLLKVREAKIVSALSIPHPPPLTVARGEEELSHQNLVGGGGIRENRGGGILAQIRRCKAATWQQPHLD